MFHVVLFEPEIPPNTGNVIRLCANTGAVLHLVKPLGFRLDDRSLRRSGLDYHDLASVKVHQCLDACLTDRSGRRAAVRSGDRRAASLQRSKVPRRRCVSLRPGNPRPAGGRAQPGGTRILGVHSHAGAKPQHQPIQCRGADCLRGLAADRVRRLVDPMNGCGGRPRRRRRRYRANQPSSTATQRPPMCVSTTVPPSVKVRPHSRLGRPRSTPW